MLVHELMTSPATSLQVGSPLDEAIRVLAAEHITAVPIVSHDNEVVGIISEADILQLRLASERRVGRRSNMLPSSLTAEAHRVDEVMTRDPVTVPDDCDIAEATQLLAGTGWKSLPVVRDGRLVGMVSRSDVLRALALPDDEVQARISDDFAHVAHGAWRLALRGRRTESDGVDAASAAGEPALARGHALVLRNLRRWPRASSPAGQVSEDGPTRKPDAPKV